MMWDTWILVMLLLCLPGEACTYQKYVDWIVFTSWEQCDARRTYLRENFDIVKGAWCEPENENP